MAATKNTTTKKSNSSKKSQSKPELNVLKNDAGGALSVFEKIAIQFIPKTTDVSICDGVTVSVRSRIGLGEMMMVVKHIVDACIDEDRGEVYFELFEYVTKMTICSVYCNETTPENNEVGYLAAVGAGRMYDVIVAYIDEDQISNIWSSARERLSAKSNMFASAAVKITVDMLQKMNALYDMMNEVSDSFVDGDMNDAIKNIVEFTKEK